ncbi:hypothetical protein [Streptomyces aureoversilis]|uniref:Uncharacterized protein n=1 Tax=Streptomyces aureoversilis TaxID=67277 RepID=A0ABW0A9A8_9ACTN
MAELAAGGCPLGLVAGGDEGSVLGGMQLGQQVQPVDEAPVAGGEGLPRAGGRRAPGIAPHPEQGVLAFPLLPFAPVLVGEVNDQAPVTAMQDELDLMRVGAGLLAQSGRALEDAVLVEVGDQFVEDAGKPPKVDRQVQAGGAGEGVGDPQELAGGVAVLVQVGSQCLDQVVFEPLLFGTGGGAGSGLRCRGLVDEVLLGAQQFLALRRGVLFAEGLRLDHIFGRAELYQHRLRSRVAEVFHAREAAEGGPQGTAGLVRLLGLPPVLAPCPVLQVMEFLGAVEVGAHQTVGQVRLRARGARMAMGVVEDETAVAAPGHERDASSLRGWVFLAQPGDSVQSRRALGLVEEMGAQGGGHGRPHRGEDFQVQAGGAHSRGSDPEQMLQSRCPGQAGALVQGDQCLEELLFEPLLAPASRCHVQAPLLAVELHQAALVRAPHHRLPGVRPGT